MHRVRLQFLARFLLLVLAMTVAGCADRIIAPDRFAHGARASLDDDGEGGGEPTWDDTLSCRSGWTIINGRIVCDPE
jgi:hypothetical protein